MESPFLELHDRFWKGYVGVYGDNELTHVIQPGATCGGPPGRHPVGGFGHAGAPEAP